MSLPHHHHHLPLLLLLLLVAITSGSVLLPPSAEAVDPWRWSEVNREAGVLELFNGGNSTEINSLVLLANSTDTSSSCTLTLASALSVQEHSYFLLFDATEGNITTAALSVPFCPEFVLPEDDFCLTIEVNHLFLLRFPYGTTTAPECEEELTHYPHPSHGLSLHFNLAIDRDDELVEVRPPSGPYAAYMECLPTPGEPAGDDCFQAKVPSWTIPAWISLGCLVLSLVVVAIVLVVWYLRHRREIANSRKYRKSQKLKKVMIEEVLDEEEEEEEKSSSSISRSLSMDRSFTQTQETEETEEYSVEEEPLVRDKTVKKSRSRHKSVRV